MYILIVSIQIISFYLIFLTMTSLRFRVSEALLYGFGTLAVGWLSTSFIGVWGAGVIGLYFLAICLIKRNGKPVWWDWFAVLYSLIMNTLIGYLTWDAGAWLVRLIFSRMVLSTEYIEYLVNALTPALLNGLAVYSAKIWLKKKHIQDQEQISPKLLIAPVCLMAGVILLLYPLLSYGNVYGSLERHQLVWITALWVIAGGAIIYLVLRYLWGITREIRRLREKQTAELIEYSTHIERLYDELKGFRHDYANILAVLEQGIYDNDMETVRTAYEKVVKPSGMLVADQKYSFVRLKQIQVTEVKSLLSAKLIMADHKGLKVQLEAETKIDKIDMELITLVRILAILLDNAIEAAAESAEKILSVAVYEDEGQQVFDIRNSVNSRVDIKLIRKSGFSTKGTGRGIGLSNVAELLRGERHVLLLTEQEHHMFIQKISIRKQKG